MASSRWSGWLPECFSGSARRRTEADSEDGELEAFGAQSSPAQGGIEARGRELLHGHSSCAEANAQSASRPGLLNDQGNRPDGPVSGRTGSTHDCLPSEPTMAGSARHLLLHSHTTICEGSRAGLENMEDTFNARVLAALKPVNAPNPQHFLRCISSSDLLDLPCNEPQAPAHRARNTYSSYFQYEAGQWTAQDASDDDDSPASASSGSNTSSSDDNDPTETRDFPSKGDLLTDIIDTHPVPEDQRSWGSAQSV